MVEAELWRPVQIVVPQNWSVKTGLAYPHNTSLALSALTRPPPGLFCSYFLQPPCNLSCFRLSAFVSALGPNSPPLLTPVPCRRASHFVVEEGQEVPTLACDAVCELEGRRSQLAGAFGVEHPEHHVSYFDRHRVPVFSGQLLAAAQKHPKAVEGLEKAFAAFLADGSAKRCGWGPGGGSVGWGGGECISVSHPPPAHPLSLALSSPAISPCPLAHLQVPYAHTTPSPLLLPLPQAQPAGHAARAARYGPRAG